MCNLGSLQHVRARYRLRLAVVGRSAIAIPSDSSDRTIASIEAWHGMAGHRAPPPPPGFKALGLRAILIDLGL